jgi:arylsulfatase A-like enzyme
MMNRREFLIAGAATASAPAQAVKPPNLLVIISDQLRFDALSSMGNKVVETPNLDRLAREGTRFENAMCACPVCVPSRTGMLTGKSMANSTVRDNPQAQDANLDVGPTYDNLLHDRGYKSQYYGKWHVPYKAARTYDNKVADVPGEHRDFLAYIDQHVARRQPAKGELNSPMYNRPYTASPVDAHYADAQAGVKPENYSQQDQFGLVHVPKEYSLAAYPTDLAIQALGEMKDGPFSLTCSIGPPHPPFLNVEPYWGMYPWADLPLSPNVFHDLQWAPYRQRAATMAFYHDAERVKRFESIYYGMVKEVDDQAGRILRRLDDLGLTRNTLVVFTADHGEMMGSHGLVSKMVLHEEAVHVPLLMRLPAAMRPGTVVHDPVSGLDLFATILDYLDVPAPPRDGDSLRPLVQGKPGADYRVSEWGVRNQPSFMVRTRDWKLIMADSPQSRAFDALYDLNNDPYEMRNLLGEPADRKASAARAEEMKERLLAWLARVHSPVREGVKARKLSATGAN